MRVRLIIGAAAAALALAGCGPAANGGSPVPANRPQDGTNAEQPPANNNDKPANALDNVAEASKKSGTAKVAGSIEAEYGGQKMPFSSSEGAIDFTNKRSTWTTKMTGPGAGGDAGGSSTVIIDGTTGYLRYVIDGKPGPWAKFDLTVMLGQRGAMDLGSYISFMAGITKSSSVGSEEVRGQEATHYKVTVDPKKILERYPEMREFIDAMMKAAENVVPGSTKGVEEDSTKPAEYDLWVGKDGRIYRVSQDFAVKGDDGQEVKGRSVTEYYDYGAAVEITPPSDSEIKSGG